MKHDNEPPKHYNYQSGRVKRKGPSKAQMDRWSGGRRKKAWVPKLEDSGTGMGRMT
jgi:hypothetical protein